jgi:hypothetical protein
MMQQTLLGQGFLGGSKEFGVQNGNRKLIRQNAQSAQAIFIEGIGLCTLYIQYTPEFALLPAGEGLPRPVFLAARDSGNR